MSLGLRPAAGLIHGVPQCEAQQRVVLAPGQHLLQSRRVHHLRQKVGVNNTNSVKISSRPNSMAKQSSHLDGLLIPA